MSFRPSDGEKLRIYRILPWLHFSGALLVVVFNALFAAVHSPLGQEISAGESPGFSWIQANITTCAGFGLVYLVLVCWIQLRQMRQSSFGDNKLLPFLVCLQILGVAAIALMLFFNRTDLLPLVNAVLLISILIQGVIAFRCLGSPDFDPPAVMLQKPAANASLFFILLFIVGAVISFLDPSRHRLADQILLDSNFESHLASVFPSILSGIISVWLGVGMLIIITGLSRLLNKFYEIQDFKWIIFFLIFFSLVAVFTAFLFLTLFYAVSWQINSLHLKSTVGQLIIFLSVSGGILFSRVFYRIIPQIPQPRQSSLIGVVALTFGAAVLFPITRLLTYRRNTKTGWILLLISTLGACVFIGYVILFGDLFNPWFTAFSYLKGAVLKIISLVAAGTALLLIEQFFSLKSDAPSNNRRLGVALAITAALGFLPFYALEKYPEVKVAVLQFNELTRVDTTFAREVCRPVGIWQMDASRATSTSKQQPPSVAPAVETEQIPSITFARRLQFAGHCRGCLTR